MTVTQFTQWLWRRQLPLGNHFQQWHLWLADDDSSQNDYHQTYHRTVKLLPQRTLYPFTIPCLMSVYTVSAIVCCELSSALFTCQYKIYTYMCVRVWQIRNIKERSTREFLSRGLQLSVNRNVFVTQVTERKHHFFADDCLWKTLCVKRRTQQECWHVTQPLKVNSAPQWDQNELFLLQLTLQRAEAHFLSPEPVFIRCKQSKHEGNSKKV